MARVVMAMSGGVDSSVAAWLLQEAGHEVIGVFMRHGHSSPAVCESGTNAAPPSPAVARPPSAALPQLAVLSGPTGPSPKQGCCTAADAQDARRVADRLRVPFYALNLEREFGQIIDYFANEYLAGRTPNPCVMCNNWIKFGKLFDYADTVGAEFVATGHYARIAPAEDGQPALWRGHDADKDQSYVLFGLPRSRLARVLLPVGQFTKPEIRARARALQLRVADKPDSQEICFVPGQDHAAFIRRLRPGASQPGEIVSTTGEVLGRHQGIERFTIGQRRGLRVAAGERRYVVRIEPETQRVVLGQRENLACARLTASAANWLAPASAEFVACQVKIRYNGPPAAARVRSTSTGGLQVEFQRPHPGVAPGQAVVCYDGQRVLCGGWID